MKEELLALQELFKETMEKYGIEYGTATTINRTTWITIELGNGLLKNVKELED